MDNYLKTSFSPLQWLQKQIVQYQLNSPLGYGLLLGTGLVLGFLISVLGIKFGAVVLVLVVGIPVLGACLFQPMFGICVSLVLGILVSWLAKYAEVPWGVSLDALLFVLFFGLLIRQVKERDFGFAKSPISAIILIWVFYNIIQVINPAAGSQLAWVFTVRTMAGLILLYFIACYAFSSLGRITFMIKFIIGMGVVAGLYALKQEFFGFSNTEINWLNADEKRYQLIVQWSRTRVFSFFSDPTTFGIYMAYMGTFCLTLVFGPFTKAKRILLGLSALIMFAGMAYAGSRTPFVLVPFGLVIFTLMTLRKDILIAAGICIVLGSGAILKSTSNAVVYRIQSAFLLSKSDDTMQVRYENQKLIRPYIYSHPFGAGLGSTGIWGKRFTPDSFLAKFPHDSAFVRVAVELGWIGLILFAALLLTIIRTSLFYALRCSNPMIKAFYVSITVVIFQLTLASYPQEAIPILPTSLIFYTFLGMVVRMKDFDPVFRKKTDDDADQPEEEEIATPTSTGLSA